MSHFDFNLERNEKLVLKKILKPNYVDLCSTSVSKNCACSVLAYRPLVSGTLKRDAIQK